MYINLTKNIYKGLHVSTLRVISYAYIEMMVKTYFINMMGFGVKV